jgi:hypothetical protein
MKLFRLATRDQQTSLAEGSLYLSATAEAAADFDLGDAVRLLHPRTVSPMGSEFLKLMRINTATVADIIDAIVSYHLAVGSATTEKPVPHPAVKIVWDQLQFIREHLNQCVNDKELPAALLVPGTILARYSPLCLL